MLEFIGAFLVILIVSVLSFFIGFVVGAQKTVDLVRRDGINLREKNGHWYVD